MMLVGACRARGRGGRGAVVGEGRLSGAAGGAPGGARGRRLLVLEVVVVLAASFGRSAVASVIDLMGSLTARTSLSQQHATLNGSASPRPWLDLTWQVFYIGSGFVPVLLVAYLLLREHVSLRVL